VESRVPSRRSSSGHVLAALDSDGVIRRREIPAGRQARPNGGMATQHQLVQRPRRSARRKQKISFCLLLHLRQARTFRKGAGTAHVVPFCASTENDLTAAALLRLQALYVHMRPDRDPGYLWVCRIYLVCPPTPRLY
jgi:hypothetical protein